MGLLRCCLTPHISVSLEAFVVLLPAHLGLLPRVSLLCFPGERSCITRHRARSLICRGFCVNLGQNLLALSASSAAAECREANVIKKVEMQLAETNR